MAGPSDPRKIRRIFRIIRGEDPPFGEAHLLSPDVELRRRYVGELAAQPDRGEVDGTGGRAGEAAGIIAGGDRPRVLRRVERRIDADCGQVKPEHIGDDLGGYGAVALALRQ